MEEQDVFNYLMEADRETGQITTYLAVFKGILSKMTDRNGYTGSYFLFSLAIRC